MPPGRSPRCPHRDTRSRRAPSLHRPTARGTILLLPDSRTTGRQLARNLCSPLTFPLRAAIDAAVSLGAAVGLGNEQPPSAQSAAPAKLPTRDLSLRQSPCQARLRIVFPLWAPDV